LEKYIQIIKERFQKLTAEEKRRFIVFCTAAFAFLLTLSVIISVINSGSKTLPLESERNSFTLVIPAEELFLPDEPDFLPGVLLEREKRASWSEQDAAEYWQDPLRAGEEPWRRKIEAFIDKFLERVP